MQRPTVFSLSTIPPRFDLIGPTLETMLAQKLPAAEIHLNIPFTYRRFGGWDGILPKVPAGVTIKRCDDLGPATKVLPTCRDLAGQDVDILFGDDDKNYDPEWHGRFKRCRAEFPDFCIVEAGDSLPDISDDERAPDRLPRAARWTKKPLSYRIKRLLSGFRLKSSIYATSGFIDILGGHGGVMVRPDWFGPDALEIPDVIWTVDDPWLSGHLEKAGIPIWLNAGVVRIANFASGDVHALVDFEDQGKGRMEADLAAIEYFRSRYGIWEPKGEVAPVAGHMGDAIKELARRGAARRT